MKAFPVSHLKMLMAVALLLVSFTNKNRFLDSVEVHSHTDVLFCPPFCSLLFAVSSSFFFFFFLNSFSCKEMLLMFQVVMQFKDSFSHRRK